AAPPVHRFEATGDSSTAFLDLAHRLNGPDIPSVELVQTGALTLPGPRARGAAGPAASVTDRRSQ
ncbi:MAG TPA: glutamate racemase, partial [Agromyces sp.]|nr:glutamate racemase [Agromyces sp.]